jgi:hypothetical protein
MNPFHSACHPVVPVLAGCLFATAVQAGEPAAAEVSSVTGGDWSLCDWMTTKPGTIYKNPENPFLQELVLGGRFQWQAAYVSGNDVNGYGFSDDYTDVRRFRLESSAAFLRYFKLKAGINLIDDSRFEPGGGEADWDYQDFDEALLSFDIKKAFGLDAVDALSLTYGRHKFNLGHEVHSSSKELLTVERSAIANKVYGSYRPTGLSGQVAKGRWALTGALFSSDEGGAGGNNEFLGGWNDGLAYYTSLRFDATDEWSFLWDFVYNDADAVRGEDSLWAYSWATSLAADYDAGRWGLIVNGIYGDNGDASNGVARRDRQGDFWGLVVMPHAWLVEEKLEAVFRYQYAGSSESQGLRTNSRYFRADHGPVVNVNGGRGNEHHALYAGLNYYFCGHNLKVQSGLEYDWMNSPGAGIDGDTGAFTWWFGFRSFF